MSLTFGWRTAVLLVAAAILLPLSAALWQSLANRVAARTLAALLMVLVGVFTPWMIGFAGFYDAWRWLTFLPVAVPLWVPALLYLYTYALVHGRWPHRGWWLLLPGVIEFAFQAGSFVLPMPLKYRWADIAGPIAEPIAGAALIVAFVVHTHAGVALLRGYRNALAEVRSDDARYATGWLKRSLLAFALLWACWVAILVWNTIAPLGYEGLMGLYVLIAAFALYLGIEGWRHTLLPFPTLVSLQAQEKETVPAQPERDWQADGKTWAARIRAENWAHDADLSLAGTARRLGTNTNYLSRALNEGLGVNFSTFINGIRCEAVAASLRGGSNDDILALALDAGFASKASFNRAFRAAYSVSPTEYRRRVSKPE